MTTGCRLLVMKRSLIWAFTSVSPATCAGATAAEEMASLMGMQRSLIWAFTSVSPATWRRIRRVRGCRQPTHVAAQHGQQQPSHVAAQHGWQQS